MSIVDERSIKEKRAQCWDGMRAIIEAATGAQRGLSDSERTEYDTRAAELDGLDKDLERLQAFNARNAAATAEAETRGVSVDQNESRKEREARAFSAYLRFGDAGVNALSAEERSTLRPTDQSLETRFNPLSTAPGAPSAGSTLAGEGGYLVPQGFWMNLQVALKEFGGIAPLFRQVSTESGNPMPWPTHDPTSIVGTLLSENTQVTEVDFSFGQGMLSAWTFTSGLHLASIQIINDSAFDVDSFVRDRVGESIGRAIAAYAHTGTGSSQPLGIETAITARGAVSGFGGTGGSGAQGGLYLPVAASTVYTFTHPTGATKLSSGLMGFDDVLNMIATVDPAYRVGATWVMSDIDLQKMRGVTDQFGHPLWNPSVQVGGNEPDRLYGYPVVIDNNTTSFSTSASTLGGPIFGAMDHAMVQRTVNQAGVMRLVERYADFLQVGYIGYMRTDIRSNDMRAVTQFKQNAT